jgi:hypothetical protein
VKVRYRCECGVSALIWTSKVLAAQPRRDGPCGGQHVRPVVLPTGDTERAMRIPPGGELAKAMGA